MAKKNAGSPVKSTVIEPQGPSTARPAGASGGTPDLTTPADDPDHGAVTLDYAPVTLLVDPDSLSVAPDIPFLHADTANLDDDTLNALPVRAFLDADAPFAVPDGPFIDADDPFADADTLNLDADGSFLLRGRVKPCPPANLPHGERKP